MGHQAALAPLDHRAEIRHCEATWWSLAATRINSRAIATKITILTPSVRPVRNRQEACDARRHGVRFAAWRQRLDRGFARRAPCGVGKPQDAAVALPAWR